MRPPGRSDPKHHDAPPRDADNDPILKRHHEMQPKFRLVGDLDTHWQKPLEPVREPDPFAERDSEESTEFEHDEERTHISLRRTIIAHRPSTQRPQVCLRSATLTPPRGGTSAAAEKTGIHRWASGLS